ncbi:MAG: hypothetical protein ACTSR8_03390 [Promethearchaeota archaeon]
MFSMFKRRQMQDIKELEAELDKKLEKSNADLLSFVDVKDKVKGLSILQVKKIDFNHKLLAGSFADL